MHISVIKLQKFNLLCGCSINCVGNFVQIYKMNAKQLVIYFCTFFVLETGSVIQCFGNQQYYFSGPCLLGCWIEHLKVNHIPQQRKADYWENKTLRMFWFCNLHIQTMTYLAITGWLFMSIGLSNINKWVFSEEHFSYPLFLTTLHMLSSCIFGSVAIRYTPLGAAFGEGNDRLRMPPKSTLKIFILSVVFTLAIAFGNIALQHLYISFLKMVFALTPLVTVGLSRLCFQRPVDSYVLMSMVPLCCGSMFCITGEVNFSVFGFVAAVAATILRALKSLLQGIVLLSFCYTQTCE